jgi:adenine-specific DNA-methyltransferase
VPARGWRNRPETMQRLWAEGRIEFGPDHTTQPQRRYYLDEHPTESVPSIVRWAGSDDALFAAWDLPFDHPKPVRFTADLIQWFGGTSGVVLDPFAGSGTVGHATWMANAADGGTRRFVLVQNEEPARVGRFRTVAEIAEARLHRAAQETGTTFRRIDICAAMRGAGDTAQEEGRGGPARSATAPPKNIR